MDRITIIGLGPMGTAIGLGLKRAQLLNTEIVGTGRERGNLVTASKMGAVDSTSNNLGSAVQGAVLVVLDTDLDETKELMEALGGVLAPGTVVTDTGSTKGPVMEWAASYLREGVSFVGGHPLPKRVFTSQEDADPTAFDNSRYCVIPSKTASAQAVKTVVGMVEKLGAEPFFLNVAEHDTYAAAMASLPVLLSSAFMTRTSSSESWRDMSSLAAAEFREISRLATTDPEAVRSACMANQEGVIYWLDQMILELYSYRNKLQSSSNEFLESLVQAWEARAKWERGMVVEPTGPEMPTIGQSVGSMFVGQRLASRQSKILGADKKKQPWRYIRRKR